MAETRSRIEDKRIRGHHHVVVPDRALVAVAVLVALWCAGFAAISVWFELTDYFGTGRYADDETAISVVNWFVVALKVGGVALAILAVHPRLVAPDRDPPMGGLCHPHGVRRRQHHPGIRHACRDCR